MSDPDHVGQAARDWRLGGLWTAGLAGAYLVFLGLARVLVAERLHGPYFSPYFALVLVTTLLAALVFWPVLARAAASSEQRQIVEQVLMYGVGGALGVFLLLLFSRSIDGPMFSHVANFVGRDLVRAAQIHS
ncbi:hypothetical protein [Caulobacter sp. X]|uniref:hypothetical protein n=1 Tax=Caulobacter sp. X TaxID=2048901 RepID=UPI000C152A06|nr:hypothetical protein [Caulobacter sp. X]